MTSAAASFSPLSLAQHFDAPDGYRGQFGWVCGYSADAAFLNDAAERFTRLTGAQRAHQGEIHLALFLDPGHPQLSIVDVPGVAHLPLLSTLNQDFRLLHAKVALLGFRHDTQREAWVLRLLVSTGNWTRQTLEESLDLAWRLDISSESLKDRPAMACSDVRAAWSLVEWLLQRFDSRLLGASLAAHSRRSTAEVRRWIEMCVRRAAGPSRFFDNRQRSVVDEVKVRLRAEKHGVARNYLAIGSGFYESAKGGRAMVPSRVVDELMSIQRLTKTSTVDLFVNPAACQAVATSVDALAAAKPSITVRPPSTPGDVFPKSAARTLHAKFLFSANERAESNRCTSPWLYLGSGNLTEPGFLSRASKATGNLEAGVVLFPDRLAWSAGGHVAADQIVSNLLPIQRNEAISDPAKLSGGADWDPPDAAFIAPPVSYFSWVDGASSTQPTGLLVPAAADDRPFDVRRPSGDLCEWNGKAFLWKGEQPRCVPVAWADGSEARSASVPVIDLYGRIAGTALPQLELDEAWWQLADFPMPPVEQGSGEDLGDPPGIGDASSPASSIGSATPIRDMMRLVENIAARQTELVPADWPLWCNRLEQTLGQARDSSVVRAFVQLGLNPLSPLYRPEFRPSFAESSCDPAGLLYEGVLQRVAEHWRVAGLESIGTAL